MRKSNAMYAALAMIAGADLLDQASPTLRSAGSGNNRSPTPPRMDAAQAREIAAHNAEVDRRKADKREDKRLRKLTGSPR